MNPSLLFDFIVDKSAKTIYVNREFAADSSLVWDAFTQQEILDQWWAPKPWTSRTKSMEFKVGGHRFYAMVSPEGQEFWSIQKYTAITPKVNFQYFDAFSDADKNPNTDLPSADWSLDFTEANGVTLVKIAVKHHSLEDIEKIIQMGFKEGFTMTLDYLENLLQEIKR